MERLIAWIAFWMRPGYDFPSNLSQELGHVIRKGNFESEINKERTLHR